MKYGILPDDVISQIRTLFWGKAKQGDKKKVKALICYDILNHDYDGPKLPKQFHLRPYNQKRIRENPEKNRNFLMSWEHHALNAAGLVDWRTENNYKAPEKVHINNEETLLALLTNEQRSFVLQSRNAILDIAKALEITELEKRRSIIRHFAGEFDLISIIDDDWIYKLKSCLNSLHSGMGGGKYHRSLQVSGVDTKFIEKHSKSIEVCLNVLKDNEIERSGGLYEWLNVTLPPSGYVNIRYPSESLRQRYGADHLRISDVELKKFHFEGIKKVLIIENLQCSFLFDDLEETVIISGTGNNLSWMQNPNLQNKVIGYWGDLDAEGLKMLNDAKKHQPQTCSIMMNTDTWNNFEDFSVSSNNEIKEYQCNYLDDSESAILKLINHTKKNRLEQELIDGKYAFNEIKKWFSKNNQTVKT